MILRDDCPRRRYLWHFYSALALIYAEDSQTAMVEWMRNGRWSKTMDYGEGSADNAGFRHSQTGLRPLRTFQISPAYLHIQVQ